MSREAFLKKIHTGAGVLQEQTSFVQVEMTQVNSSGKWPASFFKKCKYLAQLLHFKYKYTVKQAKD